MLEFKKRVLKFSFDGKEQELKYPTVKKIKELQVLQKNEKDEVVVLEEFLIGLGLDQEVFGELEVDHMNKIVDTLINPKK